RRRANAPPTRPRPTTATRSPIPAILSQPGPEWVLLRAGPRRPRRGDDRVCAASGRSRCWPRTTLPPRLSSGADRDRSRRRPFPAQFVDGPRAWFHSPLHAAGLPSRAKRGRMNRKLFVGNLPFSTEESTLQELFVQAGPVESVRVMRDQATGRSRGFGFVEMATEEAAAAAIEKFHDTELDGRR